LKETTCEDIITLLLIFLVGGPIGTLVLIKPLTGMFDFTGIYFWVFVAFMIVVDVVLIIGWLWSNIIVQDTNE